ncbi:MAG: helix-turn-helix domain-containing protein [Isosphaeraceae bacterium]
MSLAQRIRDYRYSKGWGPDELASRAEISRTALYQIESGKTELPRAGTLRRIAVALDVPMDELLGNPPETEPLPPISDRPPTYRPSRNRLAWSASEEGSASRAPLPHVAAVAVLPDGARGLVDPSAKARLNTGERSFAREGELIAKLHDLIHSPFGDCITSIVDDLHQVLTQVGCDA